MILLYLTPYVIFSLTRHKFAEIRTREFYAETRIAYTLVYRYFIYPVVNILQDNKNIALDCGTMHTIYVWAEYKFYAWFLYILCNKIFFPPSPLLACPLALPSLRALSFLPAAVAPRSFLAFSLSLLLDSYSLDFDWSDRVAFALNEKWHFYARCELFLPFSVTRHPVCIQSHTALANEYPQYILP